MKNHISALAILLGWLLFIVGDACVIILRAKWLRRIFDTKPFDASGYLGLLFLIAGALVILVSACLVAFGTCTVIRRRLPRDLDVVVTLIAFAVQLAAGLLLFDLIGMWFHIWAGGPL